MATRVFNLRNVPDDEAEEVRQLLVDNGIGFYETPAGNWGISMPSFWVKDDSLVDQAKAAIKEYQQQRTIRMREAFAQLQAEGRQRTFVDLVSEQPMRFILYVLLILFLLYISISPFLKLG